MTDKKNGAAIATNPKDLKQFEDTKKKPAPVLKIKDFEGVKLDGNSTIVAHLKTLGVKRNDITRLFEIPNKVLSEQELNGIFLKLQIDNPNIKGITKQAFETILNSDLLESFNPLESFIEKYKSKAPEENISTLATSLILANKSLEPIVKTFIKKWLVGMVASIYDDNYNPLMIVLIGQKGCGKTEFFRRLLPVELKQYFAQSKFADGKDSEALMCEMLLILNDELDGLHAREAKAFRNFISANYYYYRPPYGKQNVKRKRLASVCGASNDSAIVNDPDNNRRIIPIEIIKVNHDLYNSIDKVDLLIEAYQLYKNGFDWNLTSDDMTALDQLSEEHALTCTEYDLLQKYFGSGFGQSLEMTPTEILEYLQGRTAVKLNINKITPGLKRLGYSQELKKVNGKTKRVYNVFCSEQSGYTTTPGYTQKSNVV